VVNYVLIAVNVFVFVVFQGMGANDTLTYKLATVPAQGDCAMLDNLA
jgi:hypothetical protein